jgi:hypothetical protein
MSKTKIIPLELLKDKEAKVAGFKYVGLVKLRREK